MRKTFIFAFFAIVATIGFAQENKAVTKRLEQKYDDVHFSGSFFDEGDDYYRVELNGKVGACNLHGMEIVPPKYEEVFYTYDEDFDFFYYEVTLNGKVGLLDKKGKEILPCEYTRFIFYEKPYIIVSQGGYLVNNSYGCIPIDAQWGVYDLLQKKVIVTCKYDYVSNIAEGLAAFNIGGNLGVDKKMSGGKWGYVELKNGKEIITAQYETAGIFEDGYAQVALNKQTTLIENPLVKSKVNIGKTMLSSDVDVNIPIVNIQNEETFVFIFANEHYDKFSVPFAANDGKIFKEYCAKTLGVPEKNIRFYENATYGTILSAINKLKDYADAYDGDARFIVYYSGQGITDENTKIPYLLPVDASLNNLSATGYSVEKLNRELSELSTKSVWLIVDACFNGTDKEGKMLASARGVAVKPKTNLAEGNLILFSATSGSETAYAYKEKNHGLFTYFFLKKLQESKGDITGKSLADYVIGEVKKQSLNNTNLQSPSVIVSDKLTNWQTLKIK